jgi:GNAT superfamily N-acetyltransferase
MGRLIAHLIETDPERAWLATNSGIVAFGIAVARERFSFLSFLFVRPELQAKGIGRELLGRCMAGPDGTSGPRSVSPSWRGDEGSVRATCVDALQPVSTGLYAEQGIVPRLPLFSLVGRPDRGALKAPGRSIVGVPFESIAEAEGPEGPEGPEGARALADTVDAIDRDVVGFLRPDDHDFWQREGRRGVLYQTADSKPLGYGYVQPSGRVGPIALADSSLAVPVLGDLMRRVRPAGAWQVVVPGNAVEPLVALLRAGLRFEGSPALYCATRPSIDFERYLPAGFALI